MSWHYKWTSNYWPLGSYNSATVLENATEIYNQMTSAGWTHNAACAALGNLAHESGMNPGQWQGGYFENFSGGFGLAQWTPATRISNYCGSRAESDMSDGAMQMRYLLNNNPTQWSTYYINSSGYSSYYKITVPYYGSFAAFQNGTASVADMTAAYMVCWERPAAQYAALSTRQQYAAYYDEYFGGSTPTGTYSCYVISTGNGRAWASPATGKEGDTIWLHYIAGSDAEFVKWEVLDGGVTISGNTITMPARNVTIQAVFTGDTPGPEPEEHKLPIWMLFKWRR